MKPHQIHDLKALLFLLLACQTELWWFTRALFAITSTLYCIGALIESSKSP